MKKLSLAFAVVLFTILAASNQSNAQKASNNLLMDAAIVSANAALDGDSKNDIDKETVNPKAVRHFEKRFKDATNVKWMGLKDGFMAKFTHDDMIESVYYYTNGSLAGTLKGYAADKLPGEIGSMVEESYPGYTITYVHEAEVIKQPGIPAYIMHLQNKDDVKVIRICDGEMDVIFDCKKNGKLPKRF